MGKIRLIFFISLIAAGMGLLGILYVARIRTQYTSTLAPFFQVMGRTTKSVDRVLSRVIPVDSLDEKEFGKGFKIRYDGYTKTDDPDFIYLNKVMSRLSEHKKKPFSYKVYPIDDYHPNAFALPGGVILVTRKLLEVLKTEGELAAILAHEMGHIEKSHCFDRFRFTMLEEKTDIQLGEVLDIMVQELIGHSFSKTEENEADEYAYRIILKTKYDPASVGSSFARLNDYYKSPFYDSENDEARIIRDYFMSHPPLKLRMEKFSAKAGAWRKLHNKEKRYAGKKNLQERVSFSDRDFGDGEWR